MAVVDGAWFCGDLGPAVLQQFAAINMLTSCSAATDTMTIVRGQMCKCIVAVLHSSHALVVTAVCIRMYVCTACRNGAFAPFRTAIHPTYHVLSIMSKHCCHMMCSVCRHVRSPPSQTSGFQSRQRALPRLTSSPSQSWTSFCRRATRIHRTGPSSSTSAPSTM